MPLLITSGATLMCSFGMAPSTLNVLPTNKTFCGTPAAVIMDSKPMANIPPFGMCMSIANPSVSAATSAAMGVLTPMPCVPVLPAPWTPGSPTVQIGGLPALTNTSKCSCMWGGVIQITVPPQVTTQVA